MNTIDMRDMLVKTFVQTAKYLDKKEAERAEAWRVLAPMQFGEHELVDGYTITEGPLLSAALDIAEQLKDSGQKNRQLSVFRNELQRALCDYKGWDRKDPLFKVGVKMATKTQPARLTFKAASKDKQTVSEALAGLIKVYGIDEVSGAIMGHADLLTKVADDIASL